jgi:hypothetical protein
LRRESDSPKKLPRKPTKEVTVPLGLNKDLFATAVEETKEFCKFGDKRKFGVVISKQFFEEFIKAFDVLHII